MRNRMRRSTLGIEERMGKRRCSEQMSENFLEQATCEFAGATIMKHHGLEASHRHRFHPLQRLDV